MGMTKEQIELEQLIRTHHATESEVQSILELTKGYSEMMNLTDFLEKNPKATPAEIIEKAISIKMTEQFMLCLEAYPPDFTQAEELLGKGADIHFVNFVDEPLLEDILMGYPVQKAMNPCTICDEYDGCDVSNCEKSKQAYDSEYLVDVVRFFLENGYDVSGEGGRFGADALRGLCWSSCDKHILEAAKLLLDAGADPLAPDEDGEDVLASIDWVSAGCIPVDEDLESECLYQAYYDIVEGKIKGLNYNQIQWWDAAVGKQINRIISCAPSMEKAVYTFSAGEHQYQNCFEDDIILDCEGVMLAVTQYCHAYVNPNKVPQKPIEISDRMENLIGKRIVEVKFSLNRAVKGRRQQHGSMVQIFLDDGSKLVVRDNADQFDEEYCARFEIE